MNERVERYAGKCQLRRRPLALRRLHFLSRRFRLSSLPLSLFLPLPGDSAMEEMTGDSTASAELAAAAGLWGTWQELVLGGAVLRLGAADWSSIAAELRRRFSHPFTPQECEAKYEDVQERFSDFDDWFEALRRQRVKELKMELAKSEDSIGYLQLKLEYLKAKVESEQGVDYNSGRSESPFPNENVEVTDDASSKEPSTTDPPGWSPDAPILASVSAQGKEVNLEVSKGSAWTILSFNGDAPVMPGNLRRKRGARKRRFHVEESKGLHSQETAGPSKEGTVSGDSVEPLMNQHRGDLEGILDAILEHEAVSLFSHRLDSQKKSRYRRMVRRHVDFQTVRSRISDGSISSAKEVFRDLLLLSNNALSAVVLRGLVAERLSMEACSPSRSSTSVISEQCRITRPAVSQLCDQKPTALEEKPEEAPEKGLPEDISGQTPVPKRRGVGRPAMGAKRGLKSPKASPARARRKIER
ncbi:unnamed protein product [Spirodela intermedia]|uniref:Bromo domain-containing protein n=1 Tax=Spirodela intermedia TaxID=51605 RepID=A0A7I8JF86_SPIIN|nr:unnamed protein product [Spirodela intermedia]CAA6668807.1 unnamed protein product [Spirodela intermedia]